MLSLSVLGVLTAAALSLFIDPDHVGHVTSSYHPSALLSIVNSATKKLAFSVDEARNNTSSSGPAYLSVQPGPLLQHHGDAIKDMEDKIKTPTAYGFSQIFAYTVLDQRGKPIRKRGMLAREKIVFIGGNVDVGMEPGEVSFSSTRVDDEGRFADLHALFTETEPALPPGSVVKFKQILSVIYEGSEYTLGSICIDKYVDRVDLRLYATVDVSCD
jgi:hypothetical protein